jgi:hypothetical protein
MHLYVLVNSLYVIYQQDALEIFVAMTNTSIVKEICDMLLSVMSL